MSRGDERVAEWIWQNWSGEGSMVMLGFMAVWVGWVGGQGGPLTNGEIDSCAGGDEPFGGGGRVGGRFRQS